MKGDGVIRKSIRGILKGKKKKVTTKQEERKKRRIKVGAACKSKGSTEKKGVGNDWW